MGHSPGNQRKYVRRDYARGLLSQQWNTGFLLCGQSGLATCGPTKEACKAKREDRRVGPPIRRKDEDYVDNQQKQQGVGSPLPGLPSPGRPTGVPGTPHPAGGQGRSRGVRPCSGGAGGSSRKSLEDLGSKEEPVRSGGTGQLGAASLCPQPCKRCVDPPTHRQRILGREAATSPPLGGTRGVSRQNPPPPLEPSVGSP